MAKEKLLIFIVAYNAEFHLEKILQRIPKEPLANYNYEILIIDDSSVDRTFEIAHGYQSINQQLNIKILYNPVNQGYGGNQKLGYEYAIQNNFDIVVLLHADGFYAPELLEELILPIKNKQADAVFGSRMLTKGDAQNNGMPGIKVLGNKIITWAQNRFLGSELSEYHSGYRAFLVNTLKEIPFKRNANNFRFDIHILIQLLLSKKQICEIPVQPEFAQQIPYVNSVKYIWFVFRSAVASKLHRLSIFYKPEYDVTKPTEEYDLKLGYTSSHTMAINSVKEQSNVLDIGGGQGRIARELKKKNCRVSGMDRCILEDENIYAEFYREDLDFTNFDFTFENFDTILMLDIIEHLASPEEFLDKLRAKTGMQQPVIIVTTPNIAFIIIRIQLLLGQFNYGKQGILDKTHKRLFTFRTMKRTFKQSGYEILKVKGVPAPFPKALGINFLGKSLLYINQFLIAVSRSLFSYQIYMEIRPTPVVKELLAHSQIESQKRKDSMLFKD